MGRWRGITPGFCAVGVSPSPGVVGVVSAVEVCVVETVEVDDEDDGVSLAGTIIGLDCVSWIPALETAMPMPLSASGSDTGGAGPDDLMPSRDDGDVLAVVAVAVERSDAPLPALFALPLPLEPPLPCWPAAVLGEMALAAASATCGIRRPVLVGDVPNAGRATPGHSAESGGTPEMLRRRSCTPAFVGASPASSCAPTSASSLMVAAPNGCAYSQLALSPG